MLPIGPMFPLVKLGARISESVKWSRGIKSDSGRRSYQGDGIPPLSTRIDSLFLKNYGVKSCCISVISGTIVFICVLSLCVAWYSGCTLMCWFSVYNFDILYIWVCFKNSKKKLFSILGVFSCSLLWFCGYIFDKLSKDHPYKLGKTMGLKGFFHMLRTIVIPMKVG